MQMVLTEAAAGEIGKRPGMNSSGLKLVYDTEGCGCAMSGVPALWIVPKQVPSADEIALESAPYPVMCDKKDEIFFEDGLVLDYRADRRVFMLKSGSQIYNAHLQLSDKR